MASGEDHAAAASRERGRLQMEKMKADTAREQNMIEVQDTEMEKVVDRVKRNKKTKEKDLQRVKDALNLDLANMREARSRERNRNLAQFMFCLVIMGCELDLLSFLGAIKDYWALDVQIVKILLIAMPSAYLVCILIYMFMLRQDEAGFGPVGRQVEEGSVKQRAQALIRRRNVRLEWYHFLPMARYLMLIKSITTEDVEGIFRVNSLSSFTLGSCQIVGLIFTIVENDGSFKDLSMFVYMNIISQCINWSITIMYFVTTISRRMQSSIAIASYKSNLSNLMRNSLLSLQVVISKDAEDFAATEQVSVVDPSIRGDGGGLNVMRTKIHHEIEFMKNQDLNLHFFEPIEILALQKAIYMQYADEFDKS